MGIDDIFNKSRKNEEKRNSTERLDNLTKEIDDLKKGRITSLEEEIEDLKNTKLKEINLKIDSIEKKICDLDLKEIIENINLLSAQKIYEQKRELNSNFEKELEEKKNSLKDFIKDEAKDYFITYLNERNKEYIEDYKKIEARFNSSRDERIQDL